MNDYKENDDYAAQYNIPETTLEAARLYITRGIAPGHFLTAVIENNLLSAVMYADNANLEALSRIVSFFYDQAPHNCWRSRDNMNQWMQTFEGKA